MQDPHPGGSVRIRHALAGAACCTAESAEVPDRAALYRPRRRLWRHQAVAWRPRLWMARRQEAALCQEHRWPLWLRPEHRRFADRKRRRDSRMRRRRARSRSGRHPRGPPIRPKPPRRKWFGRQLLGRRGVNRQRLGLGLRHRDLFYRHRLCLGNRQRLCRLDRQRLRRLDRQRLRDGRSLFRHAADQCRQSLGLLEIRRHRLGIRKMPCHIVIVIHDVLLVSFVRSAHRASSDEHPPLSST